MESVLRRPPPHSREKSWPRILDDAIALLSPVALLAGLAIAGGGFDLVERHVTAILAWAAVAVLLLTGYAGSARFGMPFRIIIGLIVVLLGLTFLSSGWSSSVYNTLVEAARLIAYAGFLTFAYLLCSSGRRRKLFLEGLVLAIAVVLLAALADRLFPGTEVPTEIASSRLSFPVGYWNANGLLFGIGISAFAWISREGSFLLLRWLGVLLIPAAIVGLYFTYSRGGAVAALVTFTCAFFLYRERLWMVAVVLVGAAAALPVIRVIHDNPTIADNLGGAAAPAEGEAVLVALALATVGAGALWGIVRIAAATLPGLTRLAVAVSRNKMILGTIAALLVGGLASLAIVFGGHVWNQFSGEEIYFPDDPKAHFTQLSGAGRYQFNQVAVDAFTENPALGTGAGTYRFEWARERTIGLVAQDAHSLYLESFSELGIPGGLIVLGLVAALIWMSIASWRRAGPEVRRNLALIIPMTVALLFAFGIDWFWELAVTAILWLALIGWLAANLESEEPSRSHSLWTKAVGTLLAWVAIGLLVFPTLANQYMTSSIEATESGQLKTAVVDARQASRFAPEWARPHMQLAVLAEYLGLRRLAFDEFGKAIELEPDNWQAWYIRGLARENNGQEAAAARDFLEAKKRNPLAPELEGIGDSAG